MIKMEWTVVSVIVVIAGLIGTVAVPLAKNTKAMTQLSERINHLVFRMEQDENDLTEFKNKAADRHNVYGVLRPKDQSKIKTSVSSSNTYPAPVKWQNGSTIEKVFKENDLTGEVGSLAARESAQCYSKSGDSYVVVYDLDGTNKHKAGFVKYAGGVKNAPPESKQWKNGSTNETVYADTAKKTVVGTIYPKETAYGLGKIDGMFLVLYKVTGSNTQKCGFVEYNGGIK